MAETSQNAKSLPSTGIECTESLPTNPNGLREAGNVAVKEKKFRLAAHMYTLAIDMLTQGLPRSNDAGIIEPKLLFQCNTESEGSLAKILSNRSLAHLKLSDHQAALEDALSCIRAEPSFEKGHLRVVFALDKLNAPLPMQLEAIERGIAACVTGDLLKMQQQKLRAQVDSVATPSSANTKREGSADDPLLKTREVAQDVSDPRRFIALADLGAAYAVGAHGVTKDLKEAERYLRIAAEEGEDVISRRNLGLVLLDAGRPVEAADHLSIAARKGDAEAAHVLQDLCAESDAKGNDAREKLINMASNGDARAAEIVREL